MATGDRFLDGFEENVISGPRSIRIFGKRFMESEMTSILVKVLLSRQNKLGRQDYQRKTCTNPTVTLRNACYIMIIMSKNLVYLH